MSTKNKFFKYAKQVSVFQWSVAAICLFFGLALLVVQQRAISLQIELNSLKATQPNSIVQLAKIIESPPRSDFRNPGEVFLDEVIDGVNYELQADPLAFTWGQYLDSLVLKKNGQELTDPAEISLVKGLKQVLSQYSVDFWLDFKGRQVLVAQQLSHLDGWAYGLVERVTIHETGSTLKREVLWMQPISSYYEGFDVPYYDPSRDLFLVDVSGGDGCGGSGRVYRVQNGLSRVIWEYSLGCNHDEPIRRYGGVIDSKLVVAEGKPLPDSIVNSDFSVDIHQLEFLDPVTLVRTPLPLPNSDLRIIDIYKNYMKGSKNEFGLNTYTATAGADSATRTHYNFNPTTQKLEEIANY